MRFSTGIKHSELNNRELRYSRLLLTQINRSTKAHTLVAQNDYYAKDSNNPPLLSGVVFGAITTETNKRALNLTKLQEVKK